MVQDVQCQYATTRNLAARGAFQAKYATVGWFGWLTDQMALRAGTEVLDVGCGPAWFWHSEADRLPAGLSLTLVDTSPNMIIEARANLADASCITVAGADVADAIALPHTDESFDAVLLLHVLYHVSDPRRALSEARRVLRPGGQVFVSTNAADNMKELHELGAQAFGGEAVDPGAALFSLDDAERTVSALFADVRRRELTDVMTCTDPEDAVAFLLSMPPGSYAPDEQRRRLRELAHQASGRTSGTLRTTRRNGLIMGTKASR